MDDPRHNPMLRRIDAADADRVLARAAVLDATEREQLSLARLYDVAAESGISAEAVATALEEQRSKSPGNDQGAKLPVSVRFCLTGVPDRASAMQYYWLFVGGLCASPLLLLTSHYTTQARWLAASSAVASFGALWSTSRAIRWLDRNGWRHLT